MKGQKSVCGFHARTRDFNENDVGYVPSNAPHYSENTGDTDLIVFETVTHALRINHFAS
jgi:oxalate decarboxylase/phosphoglucose isomerase-like protein (cupin superfamily)